MSLRQLTAYLEIYKKLDRQAEARKTYAATLAARGEPKKVDEHIKGLQKDE